MCIDKYASTDHSVILFIRSVFDDFIDGLLQRRNWRGPRALQRTQRPFGGDLLLEFFERLENFLVIDGAHDDHAQIVGSEKREAFSVS